VAEFNVDHEFAASADEVWALLGDFGAMASWAPGIEDHSNEGEGIGMVRRLVMAGGVEVRERLEAHDDAARSFSYSILGGAMPVQNYLGTVTVTPTEGGCRVDWGATFDAPDGVPADAISAGASQAYAGMLDFLAQKLGG
jgi:carbon monoxide dehydrogenase subunit G